MVQEETAQRFRVYNDRYYVYVCCRHRYYRHSFYIRARVYFYIAYNIENQGSSSAARTHLEFHEYKYEIKRGEMSRGDYFDSACRQR